MLPRAFAFWSTRRAPSPRLRHGCPGNQNRLQGRKSLQPPRVMAGLVPAIHAAPPQETFEIGVVGSARHARHKAGHDARRLYRSKVDSRSVRIFVSPDSRALAGRRGVAPPIRSAIERLQGFECAFVSTPRPLPLIPRDGKVRWARIGRAATPPRISDGDAHLLRHLPSRN